MVWLYRNPTKYEIIAFHGTSMNLWAPHRYRNRYSARNSQFYHRRARWCLDSGKPGADSFRHKKFKIYVPNSPSNHQSRTGSYQKNRKSFWSRHRTWIDTLRRRNFRNPRATRKHTHTRRTRARWEITPLAMSPSVRHFREKTRDFTRNGAVHKHERNIYDWRHWNCLCQ